MWVFSSRSQNYEIIFIYLQSSNVISLKNIKPLNFDVSKPEFHGTLIYLVNKTASLQLLRHHGHDGHHERARDGGGRDTADCG